MLSHRSLKKLMLCSFFSCATLSHAGVDGLQPGSLLNWKFVSDAQISPAGDRVVYVVTQIEQSTDTYVSHLWIIDGAAAPKPFATQASDYRQPQWSPDGKRLAYLSKARGHRQLFVMEMTGGEGREMSEAADDVSAFSWSPDGKKIAFLAAAKPPVEPARGMFCIEGALQCTARRDRYDDVLTENTPFRVDGLPGYSPDVKTKLAVVSTETAKTGVSLIELARNLVQASTPAWSPDGDYVWFSARKEGDQAIRERDTELYRVTTDGSSQPEQMTHRRGPDNDPVVSMTGAIAWTGYEEQDPPRSATTTNLYWMSGADKAPQVISRQFDRNITETLLTDAVAPGDPGTRLAFGPDGNTVLFVAPDHGRSELYQMDPRHQSLRSLSGELQGDLRSFSISRNGAIAAIYGAGNQPYEVWTRGAKEDRWRQRTEHATSALGEVSLSEYEEVALRSFDGLPLQAWLIKPIGFNPQNRYPLLLYVHGGPHASYGNAFFHEFQALAAAGFAVLIVNPRGSTGYGQNYADLIHYRYPGDDYKDLMLAVDAILKRPYIDPKRVGIAGGSGGGLLSAWSIAHTDRFQAALVERPVTNWVSMVTGSDEGPYIIRHWFHDYPWKSMTDYIQRSPLSLVEKVHTPVLVVQSDHDFRAPVDQGIQFYNSLKMLGRPARLALLRGSDHGLSREGPPSQRVERLQVILDWFTDKLSSSVSATRGP
jgi:dipeptidyl aminopeptidase/acylaminoacyl peptidase